MIGIFFGNEYISGYAALVILCVSQSVCIITGPGGVLLNMSGHEKIVMKILLFSATLNIILNAILIPRYGINGAAISTAISTVIWHVLQSAMSYRYLGVHSSAILFLNYQR